MNSRPEPDIQQEQVELERRPVRRGRSGDRPNRRVVRMRSIENPSPPIRLEVGYFGAIIALSFGPSDGLSATIESQAAPYAVLSIVSA